MDFLKNFLQSLHSDMQVALDELMEEGFEIELKYDNEIRIFHPKAVKYSSPIFIAHSNTFRFMDKNAYYPKSPPETMTHGLYYLPVSINIQNLKSDVFLKIMRKYLKEFMI